MKDLKGVPICPWLKDLYRSSFFQDFLESDTEDLMDFVHEKMGYGFHPGKECIFPCLFGTRGEYWQVPAGERKRALVERLKGGLQP